MDGDTVIEKSIKNFVYSKIQEQVYLDVAKSNTICIKHRSQHGSIALAMFWLRVLRHQNNYPVPKYPYKEVYDKQGNNKVILKVDSVTLTTLMDSGSIILQGMFVLEWFLNTFQTIMDAYDAPVRNPKPDVAIYRQYTENWKKMREKDKIAQDEYMSEIRAKEDVALSVVEDRASIISRLCGEKTSEQIEEEEITEKTTDISESEKMKLATDLMSAEAAEELELLASPMKMKLAADLMSAEAAEELELLASPMKTKLAADLKSAEAGEELELLASPMWSEEVIQAQLDRLLTPAVKDGGTYTYKIWKSLLNHWFSDPSRKLFIVTPSLDTQRLEDICQIILEHRLTANLDAFYVRQKCDPDLSIFEVKQKVLNKFDAKDQMFLEYKIYSSIIYPMKDFNTSFVASVKGESAEVLMSSASFHGNDFQAGKMGSLHYQKMSDVDFILRFLGPVNASVQKNG